MKILSFDIEEWFHLLDLDATKTEADWEKYPKRIHENMDRIMAVLDNNGQKATFFCLGWVARKYPEVIRDIVDRGHEIATHSDLHQLAYTQDRKAFENDLSTSIQSLEDCSGQKIRAYRAPGFSLKKENKWVFEVLQKNGIEIDCSVFPAKRAHGGFEEFGLAQPCWVESDGIRLKEFPINLHSQFGQNLIFSGGGYFRLFPQSLLHSLFAKSDYVMTYFHPRDFDAKQPMIPELSTIRKFKSYYGLKGCMSKLEHIIREFELIDLKTADEQVNWETAKVVQLD
ncbi:polysaccharide deacetylase family protein [Marinilongibacter aquaticus]|uniref:polysaccharide deacetylase family protein n=1 Tax=Marinilongibacter aquaticus TaxID=2975157 RepID=UPI0021BD107A|nr:polysaccharide deacetylase family protein [Marinilongibacter aquaticus]UBM57895.1 polysaccharide deacetylase family protein [Marinilongibacter aquaticus]